MTYDIKQIARIIASGSCLPRQAVIGRLLTDSRSLSFPDDTLFFAIKTPKGDGSDYISSLHKNGVRSFVVNDDPRNKELPRKYPNSNFIFVRNSLEGLQSLARHAREEFHGPVVAITGSNGKTVVKEWLCQLLNGVYSVTRSPKSYNSQIGVPLSLWLIDESTEMGIFEAGISQPGEMASLREMIKPTIGILTNIGEAHQENFTSEKEKCLEKLELFKQCQALVYNADDELVAGCIGEYLKGIEHIAWSRRNEDCKLFVKSITKKETETEIEYLWNNETGGSYVLPFTDDASIENSFTCMALCLHLGMDKESLRSKIGRLEAVEMRLEVIEGNNNCIIINDSYNSDLSSLSIALNFLERRGRGGKRKKTLILSDLLENESDSKSLYKSVAGIITDKKLDNIICIGTGTRELKQYLDGKTMFYDSTPEFMASAEIERRDEIILVKGARRFHFEEIAERLQQKIHKTVMEVNLNSMIANLNHYRMKLKPGTKVVCMVKAAAYGNGAMEIARTLQDQNVDYLAVAVADEGVELRNAGITTPIMVMDPDPSSFNTLFRHNLEPEIYDFRILDKMVSAAQHSGITGYPVHVKLDTGMHRLGFEQKEMGRLADKLKSQSALLPKSVFSHFAASDATAFDGFTASQAELFSQMADELQKHFKHKIIRHICNTAGIERFPQYHFDMARIGLGLYGINPIDNSIINNVSSLMTTILQIRELAPGETVGYGRNATMKRQSRIATIPIGYADGLSRKLGNGNGHCIVNGEKALYIGNICMDACMIDVTGIDCNEGDKVEIFGSNLPVTDMARWLETIPYEILTLISNRVKRVYFYE